MYVSVVIPVYNDQYFLGECLEQLARQTRKPDEVIIVDNNCSDDSVEVARKYSFTTIIKEPVQGICAATKTGLDYAAKNSDLILRCDADSRPQKDWVLEVINIFEKNSKLRAVTGPGVFYDLPVYINWIANLTYMRAYFWSVGLALGQKPLFGSNFAFTAELWTKISGHSHLHMQDIHDDIDISYHVARHTRILYLPGLQMPISGRPFKSAAGLLKRYPMALRSIFIHWPQQAPWRKSNKNRQV